MNIYCSRGWIIRTGKLEFNKKTFLYTIQLQNHFHIFRLSLTVVRHKIQLGELLLVLHVHHECAINVTCNNFLCLSFTKCRAHNEPNGEVAHILLWLNHINSNGSRELCGLFEDISGCANFTFMWPCIVTNFFIIKPNRCTNFTNLFWHETLHNSDSSSVHYEEFIHCTLSNGTCHTCL
jgi:hypothetical protein